MNRRITLAGFFSIIIAAGCNQGSVCPQTASSISPTPSNGPLHVGTGDPYAPGDLATKVINLNVCEQEAPVALHIFTPLAPGRYAVVVFQHGLVSKAIWYNEILSHLATHGFVVVAPQMYAPNTFPTAVPSASQEVDLALRVLDWLPGHLSIASGVDADTGRVGLAGHSRGGNVTWGVLEKDATRAMAVAGLDPVDAFAFNQHGVIQGDFGFPFPSLILGAGRSGSCAPSGDNHEQFYAASAPPTWHVVAPGAGHTDFYDSNCDGCDFYRSFCRRGDDPAGTRRLAAGLLVAFFRGALQDDKQAFAYLQDMNASPIPVQIESKH